MSLLSMLVLMLILCDHKFRMVLLADFFTKVQTRAHHQFYLSKLNVVDPP
jgi:hypothetical protein